MERKASILYDRDDRDLSQTRSPPTTTQTLPERRGTDILFWKQSHWLYFPDLKLVDKNIFVFGDQQWFLIVSWKVQEETALVKGRHSATIHLSRWFWEFSDWVTEALMYGTELWPLYTVPPGAGTEPKQHLRRNALLPLPVSSRVHRTEWQAGVRTGAS